MDVAKIKTLIDIMTYGITTSAQTEDDWDYWFDGQFAHSCIEKCNRSGAGFCMIKFKQI